MTPDLDTVSVVLAAIPAWVTLLALAAGIVIGWSACKAADHGRTRRLEGERDEAVADRDAHAEVLARLESTGDITAVADAVMQQRTQPQPDMLAPDWTPPVLRDPRGGRHERR